jgi:hypothetical protein
MVGERSLVPKEIPAGEMKVSRPEATATSSSSGGDFGDRLKVAPAVTMKKAGTVDPREAERSYDFGPSTVTVGASDSWRP